MHLCEWVTSDPPGWGHKQRTPPISTTCALLIQVLKIWLLSSKNSATLVHRLGAVLQLSPIHVNRVEPQYQMPPVESVTLFLEDRSHVFIILDNPLLGSLLKSMGGLPT